MREELVDRFGPVPPEVENLLKTVEIKQLCRAANIEKVDAGAKGFLVAFHNNVFRSPEKLVELVARSFGKIKVRPDQKLLIEGDLSSYAVRLETMDRQNQPAVKQNAATAGFCPVEGRRTS